MNEDKKKPFQTDVDKELEALLRSHKTVIKVIGAGGAGNNTITRLIETGIEGVQTYAINTDAQDLLYTTADQKILIGREITSGLGAGSDPKVGEDSANESEDELKAILSDTDLVFVTCGLGGGTGTGSAPVIAELAREANALTISIVTMPFSEEGEMRWNNAQYGLEKLKKNSDTLIVIENDKLLEIDPEVSLDDAFREADKILVNAVKGISELVTQKGLVNLDFADIRTIMKDGGTALIGMAESDSPDRAIEAVEKAIANPLIDLKIDGAKSALLNIIGGTDMTIKDAKTAMHTLARKLHKSAKIIWGARIDPKIEKKVSVMVLATGLNGNGIQNQAGTPDSPQKESLDLVDSNPIKAHDGNATNTNEDDSNVEKTDGSSINTSKSKESKKIFSEIMEEESDADLKILSDALVGLQEKFTDRELWEELRQASSSLAGTAQMFDFDAIAKTMNYAEDLLAAIIYKDFFFEPVVELFLDIPKNLGTMIKNESEPLGWANEFNIIADKLTKSIRSNDVTSKDEFMENLEKIRREMNEHLAESGYTAESETKSQKPEENESQSNNENNLKDSSTVSDALKSMKNFLQKDDDSSN